MRIKIANMLGRTIETCQKVDSDKKNSHTNFAVHDLDFESLISLALLF